MVTILIAIGVYLLGGFIAGLLKTNRLLEQGLEAVVMGGGAFIFRSFTIFSSEYECH